MKIKKLKYQIWRNPRDLVWKSILNQFQNQTYTLPWIRIENQIYERTQHPIWEQIRANTT